MPFIARYERNHIRLGWFHIGFASFWAAKLCADYLIAYSQIPHELWIKVLLVGLWIVTLHSALAWGAMAKSEISRRISVFVGAIMFWAPLAWHEIDTEYFPFSGYIALFMLPLTQWKAAPELPDPSDPADLQTAAAGRRPMQRLWLLLTALVGAGIAVSWYYARIPHHIWWPIAGMVLPLLFMALICFWPGNLQPRHPPD